MIKCKCKCKYKRVIICVFSAVRPQYFLLTVHPLLQQHNLINTHTHTHTHTHTLRLPSSTQHNEVATTHIVLISVCCANFPVFWLVSIVLISLSCGLFQLWLVSIVLIFLCCGLFPLCWGLFRCVVLIFLCCGLFPLW